MCTVYLNYFWVNDTIHPLMILKDLDRILYKKYKTQIWELMIELGMKKIQYDINRKSTKISGIYKYG